MVIAVTKSNLALRDIPVGDKCGLYCGCIGLREELTHEMFGKVLIIDNSRCNLSAYGHKNEMDYYFGLSAEVL
jgi:hypothetical protein